MDNGAAGEWLTYREVGERLGISTAAARQLSRRRGWQRRTPNAYGVAAEILVPEGALDPALHPSADGIRTGNGTGNGAGAAYILLLAEVARERERAERAERLFDDERRRAEHAELRGDELQLRLAEAIAVERALRDDLVQEHRRFIAHLSARAPWWRRWFR